MQRNEGTENSVEHTKDNSGISRARIVSENRQNDGSGLVKGG